jgi:hypothetical protein
LEFVKILRKQIFSKKGVYGELEHPESYAIDYKNVSHKLLDIWYEEENKKVMGRVLLLANTPNGAIATEIIKSGGLLAISARAAGEEITNPDGTKNARVKLLTTYDLVYHPGFTSAVLDFKELNESQKMDLQKKIVQPISCVVYANDFDKLRNKFAQYINMNENNKCFMQFLLESQKDEQNENKQDSKNQVEKDQDKIQNNEAPEKEELENKLKKAANDEDLKQSQKMFFQDVKQNQKQQIKRNKYSKGTGSKQGNSYYQGAAGFKRGDGEIAFIGNPMQAT